MYHYYISLSHDLICHHAAIHQSELHHNYTLLEWIREAEPHEIDRYKLVYLGHGHKSDEHIRERLRRWTYDQR